MSRKFKPIDEEIVALATPAQASAILAYNKHGGFRSAARATGMSHTNLRKLVNRALKKTAPLRGHSPEHNMVHTTPETHIVKGTSTYYDGEGNLRGQWVKTALNNDAVEQYLQEFTDEISRSVKPFNPTVAPKGEFNDEVATCYILGDAHFAMQAWEHENGVEDYDLEKGIRDFDLASGYLVKTASKTRVGVIVNVGDLMHCNDDTNSTPASGNRLDASDRIAITGRKVARAIRNLVSRALRKHEEVWIINARGNHDTDAAQWVNIVLETAYENESRVKILPNTRKFCHFMFGDVFVAVYHGDKISHQRAYEKLTSGRFRDKYGRSKKAYAWSGHIHHDTAKAIGGIKFETFNSLIPPDRYHEDAGYGADRSMISISLHRNFGEVGRTNCSIELARSMQSVL